MWLKTTQDFRYAVNQSPAGEADGLIALEVPGVSSLSYELLLDRNRREVVRHIIREIGFPQSIPPADYMRRPIYTTWVENKGRHLSGEGARIRPDDSRTRTAVRDH